MLYEFESLALSFNPDKKIGTEISDIMNVLAESDNLIDYTVIKNKFYEIFIIDALIGNTERHNGNWGFLISSKTKEITFSPIYDCGSCLNPILEDGKMACMSEEEIKNLSFNVHSCLRDDDKRINYFPYLKSMKNEELNLAIRRVFNKIDIKKINEFIDNIACLSEMRKDFYKKIINNRYSVIKDIYNKLESFN